MSSEDVLGEIAKGIGGGLLSAVVGFLGALTVFRVRLNTIELKAESEKRERELERAHDKELVNRELVNLRGLFEESCRDSAEFQKRAERRQLVMLEIVADIAKKSGVTHRVIPDSLTKSLTDED